MSHSDNCSHPPPPARACPHATCRMPLRHLVQLCSGLHPAPESSPRRGLVLVNATSGDLYQCPNGDQQLGSTAATTYVQEKVLLPRPFFQSAHPALYHVICYPTIYNCIKTHTHSDTISSYRATLNEHGSSSSPTKPNNCPIQFYAMFNILFIPRSRSHVVGAVVVGPNLILD